MVRSFRRWTQIDAQPSIVNPFSWRVIAETHDYYEMVEVLTRHDVIHSDTAMTIYKPQVTPAVAAAKQSWLGRVYLGWSKFPVVTDVGNTPIEDAPPPQPDWHTVVFEDLRFDTQCRFQSVDCYSILWMRRSHYCV